MKIWNTDTFWGRVDEKLEKKGLDLLSLANSCGLNANTLYNQRSIRRTPKAKGAVVKMAKYLGTTPEYLMTGENDQVGLTPSEEQLLGYFQALTQEQKDIVLQLARNLYLTSN